MAAFTSDHLFWDPLVYIFDFTLRFEEIILQLIPSVLAIGACVVWYNHYRHEPVYIRSSALLWAKVTTAVALVALQAANLSLRAKLIDSRTSSSIPASTLELVALVALAGVVYMGHMHCIRSSGFLALYLILTLLIDIVKSRSYFLRPDMSTLGGITAATATLRLTLLLLEEKSKRDLIIDKEVLEYSGQEATSGYLTRALLLFLNPMFIAGYYHKLNSAELMRLGLDFSSKRLHQRFKKHWEKTKDKPTRYSLLVACLQTWKLELLQLLFPRLCYVGFSFAQPFLMGRVINTVEQVQDGMGKEKLPSRTGINLGLQAATIFIFVGMAQSKTTSQHMTNRLMTQVRGGLVAELMEKTHHLSEQEAKKSSVLTHMSSDIDSISEGLGGCIDIPITILQTCLGVYLLSLFIGTSCFFVLVPIAITTCCSYLLGSKTGPAMAEWNKAIEERISKTNEVLSQLPGIKMFGLGPTMRDMIHSLRVKEMEISKRYRFFMTIVNATQQFVDLGTPVVVVAAAFFLSGFNHTMSAGQVFPTLAVVSLIQAPMQKILEIYSEICAMIACFDRIQTFLLLPERKDSRVKWDPSAPRESFELLPTHFGSTVMRRRRPQGPSPGGIIQFDGATFGPMGMEDPLLSDLHFAILRGSITGVYGGTGCGKSTLFRSILGETKVSGGYVYTDHVDIAYCGSRVWLRDASIRDNIIGCLAYDPVRYDIAIQSCQLEPDLARLPGRDAYTVGPNGFNLSGGQRQRVALARAVFARCAITIIDDCFSALDAQTARAILDALCGPNGVLRSSGSTVLMATYLPESLQVIDQMISFDGRGGVSLDQVEFRHPDFNRQISNFLSTLQSTAPREVEMREIDAIRRTWPEEFEVPSAAEEDYVRQRGSWGLYMIFIDSVGRAKCAWFSCMALLLAGTELLPQIYMRAWVERGPDNGLWFIGYSAMAAVACALMALGYWLLYSVFAVRAAVGLHEQILNVVMRATFGFLTSTNTGDLLNRFSQDSGLFARVLPYYLFRTMYMFYEAAIVIGIILSSASYMTIALPFIILAIVAIQSFYLRTSRQIRHIDLEEKAPLYTFFVETSEGIMYIQAFAWQEKNMEKGYRLLDNSQQPYYLMLCIQQWLTLVLGLLAAGVALVLVSVVIWIKKGTSGPAVGLAFLGIISFQLIMMELIQAWTGSETSVAGLGRLEKFVSETPLEPKPDPQALVSAKWPSAGDVQLTSVSARYKPAVDIPPVTRDVSLAIEAGEKIAITGRTGSGKSTLLLAILGLVQYEGKVELDGVDITTIDPDLLRSRVITIGQEPLQFNATIRKNLLPFTMNDDGTKGEDKMREATTTDSMLENILSRLTIWSNISAKGGLDAQLDSAGYSKGEIQLLSIARAIARRKQTGNSIVLIDEATSNLDPERDVATQRVMREAFRGCTVITVAHREEARQNVDCAIELVDGRVAGILHYQRARTGDTSTEASSEAGEDEEEERC
ncbi:hypothetical protein V2A60_010317 [Cordyceps javanica]